jgi:long-subunit acyl-CoA synthetase (AMP-forming)
MTDFGEVGISDEAPEAQTLSQLHLRAERGNHRRVVMQHWASGRWNEMPTWRFYRQVIRVGLYLRERLGLGPGDRVVVMSPLRPERLVADWAVVVQGAVTVGVDPNLPSDALASALAQLAPRVALVAGSSERARLLELHPGALSAERIIVFDPPTASEDASSWSQVLDLGGTLDTAERAQQFRSRARAVRPDGPALAYAERGADGSIAWRLLTHADVIRELDRFRIRVPSREGDVAYVGGRELPLATLFALWAFVGDDCTTTTIGTPGQEVGEIAELRPHVLVAPSEVIERAARSGPSRHGGTSTAWSKPDHGLGVRSWMRQVPALAPLARWIGPEAPGTGRTERLRDVMTLEGRDAGPRNRTTGDAQ